MSRIQRIETIIRQHIPIFHLEIMNESHLHRPRPDTETHLKIIAVSPAFAGCSLIARHRMIQTLCDDERHKGLHALSLALYTPEEWEARAGHIPESPPCTQNNTL